MLHSPLYDKLQVSGRFSEIVRQITELRGNISGVLNYFSTSAILYINLITYKMNYKNKTKTENTWNIT